VLKFLWFVLAAALLSPLPASGGAPEYGYRVIHVYPHDRTAFTEGLFYLDGDLFESTGEPGHSYVRRESLQTGKVLQSTALSPELFGEGIVAWKDRLYQLTWQTQIGFAYDLKTLKPFAKFTYQGEGWALTHDATRLIMSDGTPELRFLNPETLKEIGRIKVTDEGRLISSLNEIEYVNGEIYANIWMTNRIARIDPKTGHVLGWIDLTGLLPAVDTPPGDEGVLNGIAYDAEHDRLFVTGKLWPKLFEIKLVPKSIRRAKPSPHG